MCLFLIRNFWKECTLYFEYGIEYDALSYNREGENLDDFIETFWWC